MSRFRKLLGMIFIFGVVFFIICDEKGIRILHQDGNLVFVGTEKKSKSQEILDLEEIETKNASYKNSDIIRLNYSFKDPTQLRKSDGLDPDFFIVYKNSNRIKLYSSFQNPINLRKSLGIDQEFLAKLEQEKINIENQKKNQKYTGPNIISLNNDESISNIFKTNDIEQDNRENVVIKPFNPSKHEIDLSTSILQENKYIGNQTGQSSGDDFSKDQETGIVGYRNIGGENYEIQDLNNNDSTGGNDSVRFDDYLKDSQFNGLKSDEQEKEQIEEINKNTVKVEKYEPNQHQFNGLKSDEQEKEQIEEEINKNTVKVEKYELNQHQFSGLRSDKQENEQMWLEIDNNENTVKIEKYEGGGAHLLNMREGVEIEKSLVKIQKYYPKTHSIRLKKGVLRKIEFIVNDTSNSVQNIQNGIADDVYETLITDDEIDINALESENDEFLKKVFDKTKDISVMNLIVETYLNEYQFIKAKKFIESLPQEYADQVNPLLNLRVSFNSFALTSKTVDSTLISIVQNYQSNNQISEEDALRYLGIIALMGKNYDHFFEIAGNFTLDKHQAFASKVQGYKDQISKQMGMPDYYFDTLIALELFNHGFFQSAKVLSLSSLQENSNYILPYQVLAYANFLTNSRDTSVEYLKKLIDLDPNNAEKYRFLMGIAYYRDEKYEQSVVMLAMVKDEKLYLDAQRYLINNYLLLDQKNKLISSWNKLIGDRNLTASDFYTYFYEVFYHPYSEGKEFKLYAYDTELANKMIRACGLILPENERVVCTYGTIGRNIAIGLFDGLEQYLLNLVAEYPQGYLYHALGEYYVKEGDLEKAKLYLLKAVSLTQTGTEIYQIKKLLQNTI